MSRHPFSHGCTAALLLCTVQLYAQQSFPSHPVITKSASHTGLQSYRPAGHWHGLDLSLFFGAFNTATGTGALTSCTSCSMNVADGYVALNYCTTCAYNTGIGYEALQFNTSANFNTAVGWGALSSTNANSNTAVGHVCLYVVSTGTLNTAMGDAAGNSVVTGSYNTAIGANAFETPMSESYSTAIGYAAAQNTNSTSGYNTVIGAYALYGNTGSGTTGSGNTAAGYQALYSNSTGGYNYANGFTALYYNTTGGLNAGAGVETMYYNTTGNGNTAFGTFSLLSNTTGSYNTAVGYEANTGSGTLSNATALGANSTVNSSNQVVIGNTSVTSIGGFVAWSNFSDGRYKKNIQSNVPGLAFINKLNPVTYTLDIDGIEARLQKSRSTHHINASGSSGDSQDDPVMKQAMQEKSSITYTGFVAQDVEKAADSLGFVFSGVDKPKNTEQSFYGLRYSDFVPPLVKAVQELSASSDKKDSVINALQTKFDSLQTQVNELRALIMAQKASASGASLDQNVPNPFTGSTVIGFNLPKGITSAQMRITDISGNVLAVIPLSGNGKSAITADVSGYTTGTYIYSLIVDGKLAGTKQMISVK